MDATGQGAVDFLGFASEKGLMNANTAGSLRAAVREVLTAVDGDGWPAVNLQGLDVDDYAQRFERLRLGRYKPDSLTVYKSRFKNAVAMYLEYLENPSGWRYKAERPAAARTKAKTKAQPKAPSPDVLGTPAAPPAHVPEHIDYPYPLRAGFMARLTLPTDLTKAEATRLAAFLGSLAIEPVLRLTAGPATDSNN